MIKFKDALTFKETMMLVKVLMAAHVAVADFGMIEPPPDEADCPSAEQVDYCRKLIERIVGNSEINDDEIEDVKKILECMLDTFDGNINYRSSDMTRAEAVEQQAIWNGLVWDAETRSFIRSFVRYLSVDHVNCFDDYYNELIDFTIDFNELCRPESHREDCSEIPITLTIDNLKLEVPLGGPQMAAVHEFIKRLLIEDYDLEEFESILDNKHYEYLNNQATQDKANRLITDGPDAHVVACQNIKKLRKLLENDVDVLELTVRTPNGMQSVSLDLFYADSIGTLDEALSEMYEQHKDEIYLPDDKKAIDLFIAE